MHAVRWPPEEAAESRLLEDNTWPNESTSVPQGILSALAGSGDTMVRSQAACTHVRLCSLR
jgi:hypothetical protein